MKDSYNRVETEREIPKLKFVDLRIIAVLEIAFQMIMIWQIIMIGWIYVYILQEFQYGKETVRFNLHQLMFNF